MAVKKKTVKKKTVKKKTANTASSIFGLTYSRDDSQSGTLLLDASGASTKPGGTPMTKKVSVVTKTVTGKTKTVLVIAD
jgi:hypothetical protein